MTYELWPDCLICGRPKDECYCGRPDDWRCPLCGESIYECMCDDEYESLPTKGKMHKNTKPISDRHVNQRQAENRKNRRNKK